MEIFQMKVRFNLFISTIVYIFTPEISGEVDCNNDDEFYMKGLKFYVWFFIAILVGLLLGQLH